uniref:Uncharacterized protein n=1 Tax=Romanomermis culicivorax TaxID=13658 RepID=A0A915I5J3_ROMCU
MVPSAWRDHPKGPPMVCSTWQDFKINPQLATSPIGAIDVSNLTHLQLRSATPGIIDIILQAKTHRKTTGPSTPCHHHHLKV